MRNLFAALVWWMFGGAFLGALVGIISASVWFSPATEEQPNQVIKILRFVFSLPVLIIAGFVGALVGLTRGPGWCWKRLEQLHHNQPR